MVCSARYNTVRGGSRTAAKSMMECFVIITKHSILDVAAALDPLLTVISCTARVTSKVLIEIN